MAEGGGDWKQKLVAHADLGGINNISTTFSKEKFDFSALYNVGERDQEEETNQKAELFLIKRRRKQQLQSSLARQ